MEAEIELYSERLICPSCLDLITIFKEVYGFSENKNAALRFFSHSNERSLPFNYE